MAIDPTTGKELPENQVVVGGYGGQLYEQRDDGLWYQSGARVPETDPNNLRQLSDALGEDVTTQQSIEFTPQTERERLQQANTQGTTFTSGTTSGNTTGDFQFDSSALESSPQFKKLNEDDQAAVKAVFEAIASNDQKKAAQLIQSFEAAAEINDPFFAQQFKIAADTLKRGFVSIDKDLEFREQQQQNRLNDLREDIATRQEFLSLEEQNALRGIEREYEQNLKDTRQTMAARGKTFSTERAETEELLEEATGDVRESTRRRFGIQKLEAERTLERGERSFEQETERLRQLAEEDKLDIFRKGEETLGTSNLPQLSGAPEPIGDLTGTIPQQKLQDTLSAAQSMVF